MEIGLGCWQFGPSFGFWDSQNGIDSKRTIRAALRSSISHLDTAQGYGNGLSEQIIGSAIRSEARENLFLATKIMPCESASLAVEKSISRLKCQYLDLVYLHYPDSRFDIRRNLQELEQLMDNGIIRSIGLSNFDSEQIGILSRLFPISWVERPVSLLWTRGLDDQIQLCRSLNIRISGYSPLGLGLLIGKKPMPNDARSNMFCFKSCSNPAFRDLVDLIASFGDPKEVCYSWARSKNPDVLLLGARNTNQLEQDIKAVFKLALSSVQIAALDLAASKLDATVDAAASNPFLHSV